MSGPTSKPIHFAWPTYLSYISIYRLIYTSRENNLHILRDMSIYGWQHTAGWPKRLSESNFYADHEYDFRIFLSLKLKILDLFLDFWTDMFNLARNSLLIPTSFNDMQWPICRKIYVGNKKPTLESEPTSFLNSVQSRETTNWLELTVI